MDTFRYQTQLHCDCDQTAVCFLNGLKKLNLNAPVERVLCTLVFPPTGPLMWSSCISPSVLKSPQQRWRSTGLKQKVWFSWNMWTCVLTTVTLICSSLNISVGCCNKSVISCFYVFFKFHTFFHCEIWLIIADCMCFQVFIFVGLSLFQFYSFSLFCQGPSWSRSGAGCRWDETWFSFACVTSQEPGGCSHQTRLTSQSDEPWNHSDGL